MRNNKPLLYLYQVYKYLIYYPAVGISTFICGTVAVILVIFTSPKVGTFMGIVWAKFNSFMTPMFVKVIGKENMNEKQSYIIASNHQSQFDIFVIYGWLPVDFKWVMKVQLRRVPFLGYACYKLGHVFIDRSNRESAVASINAAKKTIKEGTSIVFFPEGTRSMDGNLIEFKKGAFKFAIDIGLPILPVTITGTRDVLPPKSTALFPGRVKMIFHEPIDVTDYNDENTMELLERTKAAINKGLDEYSKKRS